MPAARRNKQTRRHLIGTPSSDDGDASNQDLAEPKNGGRPTKRRKTDTSKTLKQRVDPALFEWNRSDAPLSPLEPATLPKRLHSSLYHRPQLLDGSLGRAGRGSLLRWFDSVSHTRKMPWRKSWINPCKVSSPAVLRSQLEVRAYEVWISEIMLQQTRVATVIDYWNRWMAKWPTIHDLAKASEDEVRAVWQGLGYYSRGTRILEAAKQVVADNKMKGLLPDDVDTLIDKIPGVGRYTGGAIAAIVFGKPVPMVDGNVLRVLSRQLGVFGDVQKSKDVIDLLWGAAAALVKAAARVEGKPNVDATLPEDEIPAGDVPGRWGQALMELGSTVCTPVPNCGECPVSSTCRAYGEGRAYMKGGGNMAAEAATPAADIEDVCGICEPFVDVAEATEPVAKDEQVAVKLPKKQQATLAAFAFTKETRSKSTDKAKSTPPPIAADETLLKGIVQHARKFPMRTVKKPVREEETLVCGIRTVDGRYLLSQRPQKGLLAGMWELPSKILEPEDTKTTNGKTRSELAKEHVKQLLPGAEMHYGGELSSVPWLFSHIKLTMHVHFFELRASSDTFTECNVGKGQKWAWCDDIEVEEKSMGTGMKKCWDAVRNSAA